MVTRQIRGRKRQRCNFVPVEDVEIDGSIQIHLVMSEREEYEQESHERAQLFQERGRKSDWIVLFGSDYAQVGAN